ncbi:amino acid/amide ABC transporter membrane protein 2, HAAT family [Pseudonocardia thermophila]|uniref:Amino acid/amide ABC transporter membrane protein 2, HAAT family n=1 Tax=Pseudonocardia thermophila TaxID=1848 RepID=A0A1M6XK59_PSETH|nr:branched-chain amino acid ABC transporter permease [Pseudonocardia thermophila]SHL06288.1 amino acid/amide ABC transporter membrane protein 2, HAAT family [Pseudonocardia thermophila]
MSPYAEAVLLQVGINVLLALGYWIAVSTGKYSFGHAAFMAIGAYAASMLTLNFAWPLPVAMLVAAVVAAVAGAVIGWMALRLSLLYLAIITFIFGQLVELLFAQWDYVGGATGMIGMTGTTLTLVYSSIAVVVVYLVLLTRSRLGLAYAAIREDERAATASGLRITRIAVGAFAASAAVTGVAGALAAHQLMIITPSLFGPQQALLIILYCVLGGVQYFWGAAVGAIVLSVLPIWFEWLNDWYMIVYGLLFVVLMIVRPQGLIGRSERSGGGPLLRRLRRDGAVAVEREREPVG